MPVRLINEPVAPYTMMSFAQTPTIMRTSSTNDPPTRQAGGQEAACYYAWRLLDYLDQIQRVETCSLRVSVVSLLSVATVNSRGI